MIFIMRPSVKFFTIGTLVAAVCCVLLLLTNNYYYTFVQFTQQVTPYELQQENKHVEHGDKSNHQTTIRHQDDGTVVPGQPLCSEENIFLLVYVHSAANHTVQRALIRHTWGDTKLYDNVTVKLIFMLGQPDTDKDRISMSVIESELTVHQDMVIFPFQDTYNNVTQKALNCLKYVFESCKNVSFVLKSDDDMVINIFSVIAFLQKVSKGQQQLYESPRINAKPLQTIPPTKLLVCADWYGPRARPFRNPEDKWYISTSEYPGDQYPDFCSGSAYIMSMDTLMALYNTSKYTRQNLIRFDDVSVTGLLRQEAQIKLLQIDHHYDLFSFGAVNRMSQGLGKDKVFIHTSSSFHLYLHLWNKMLQTRNVEIKPVKPRDFTP